MSRKKRVISSTDMYHIILRAVNQQTLFEEPVDYMMYLSVLERCKKKYGFSLHAYCLMSNHIHMLITIPADCMSSVFQSIGSIFVHWYNQKYKRYGVLFQGRYASFPVEDLRYFLNTLQYIHENPVKANMCRYPTEYTWSSCRAYYGSENPLVDTEKADELMETRENLLDFFATNENEIDEKQIQDFRIEPAEMFEDEALNMFRSLTGCKSPSDFQALPKVRRNELIEILVSSGISQKQVSRFGGISTTTVYRVIKRMKEREQI